MKKIELFKSESRWQLVVAAAIVVMCLTYVGDIQSMQGEVKSLRADVADVLEQINISKNDVLVSDALPTQSYQQVDVSELLKFIDDKQAILQLGEDPKSYQLELDIDSDNRLIQLLDLMAGHVNKYNIERFSLVENASNTLHVMLALTIQEGAQKIVNTSVAEIVPLPFCHGAAAANILPDQAQHYELFDLQLLGTMQGRRGLGVLIRFPNGVMRNMYVHDHLGLGGGEITHITREAITITAPNHQLTTLTFNK